jgi:O-methyltransferase involved in polyketide biosynthesis
MSSLNFAKHELAAALARGVRQCVLIGARQPLRHDLQVSSDQDLRLFTVDEDLQPDSPDTFVPTQFAHEGLADALEKSAFDARKPSLFLWLGGVGYRTADAALSSLAFIASLPKGSGIVFDYAVERTGLVSLTHTALDALASRLLTAGGSVRYLIQPPAVTALLRGLGFHQIVDLTKDGLPVTGEHIVSAVV